MNIDINYASGAGWDRTPFAIRTTFQFPFYLIDRGGGIGFTLKI